MSTPVYNTPAEPHSSFTATGHPDPVGIEGGTITADRNWSPYTQASITIQNDPEVVEALDPRTAQRIIITAGDKSMEPLVPARVFDLGLRGRSIDYAAGTATLSCATDEAKLFDLLRLATTTDRSARPHEGSLREICDWALEKIGAALQPATSGDPDPDMTAYWEVTNRAKNGGLRADATGWTAGSGTSVAPRLTAPTIAGLPVIRWTASGTGQAFLNTPVAGERVTPGEVITASVLMASGTTSRPARMMLRFWNASGVVILDSYSDPVMTSTDAANPTKIYRTRAVPPGAVSVSAFVNVTVNTAGQNHYTSALMFGEDVPFFDGATVDTHYTYTWEDAPNTSTSTRTPVAPLSPDLYDWNPGESLAEFLRPFLDAAGCRLWCDEQRRWYLHVVDFISSTTSWTASGTGAPDGIGGFYGTGNTTRAVDEIDRDDGEHADGIVVKYTWRDATGVEQVAYDVAGTAGPDDKVRLIEIAGAYPGAGGAQTYLDAAATRGRTQKLTIERGIGVTPGDSVAVRMPGTPPIDGGLVRRVVHDLAEGTAEIETTEGTPA